MPAMAAARLGVRVVRGPDWTSLVQDGGEGGLGTVVELRQAGRQPGDGEPAAVDLVVVQWDAGKRGQYRCGVEGKHELRAFDTAPAGARHTDVACSECREEHIAGIRWECEYCVDYNLCNKCYQEHSHDLDHLFWSMPYPGSSRVKAAVRNCAIQLRAEGIFPGARVMRGPDWSCGDEDGEKGCVGIVEKITDAGPNSARSVATVNWPNGNATECRIGAEGKMDIVCHQKGSGEHFYSDHLPWLVFAGEEVVTDEADVGTSASTATAGDTVTPTTGTSAGGEAESENGLTVGSLAQVPDMDLQLLQVLQDRNWEDDMVQALGQIGEVTHVDGDGLVSIFYPTLHQEFSFHPGLVSLITRFAVGDDVKMMADKDAMKSMLNGLGGWKTDMDACVGLVGKVVLLLKEHTVSVQFPACQFVFHPGCLLKVSSDQQPPTDAEPSRDETPAENESQNAGGDQSCSTSRQSSQTGNNGETAAALADDPPPFNPEDLQDIKIVGGGGDGDRLGDAPPMFLTTDPSLTNQPPALPDAYASGIDSVSAGESDLDQMPALSPPDYAGADERYDDESGQPVYGGLPKRAAPEPPAKPPRKRRTGRLSADMQKFVSQMAAIGANGVGPEQFEMYGPALLIASAIARQDRDTVLGLIASYPDCVNDKVVTLELTSLHVATICCDVEMVELLVNAGANLVEVNTHGHAVMHVAVEQDDGEMVATLGRLGAAVDRLEGQTISPLHYGCWRGSEEAVKQLIRLGADLHAMDENGETALHAAVRRDLGTMAELLLTGGADPRISSVRGFNSAHHAGFFRAHCCLTLFLARCPDLLHLREEEGNQLLHIAAINNNVDMLLMLFDQPGVDINSRNHNSLTPLMFAVMQGCLSCVEQLVAYGADLDMEDSNGDTVLHMAVCKHRMSDSPVYSIMMPPHEDTGEYSTELHEIQETLGMESEQNRVTASIACLLAREGCSLEYLNHNGASPMYLTYNTDLKDFLEMYARSKDDSKFHGSKASLIKPADPSSEEAEAVEGGDGGTGNGQSAPAANSRQNLNEASAIGHDAAAAAPDHTSAGASEAPTPWTAQELLEPSKVEDPACSQALPGQSDQPVENVPPREPTVCIPGKTQVVHMAIPAALAEHDKRFTMMPSPPMHRHQEAPNVAPLVSTPPVAGVPVDTPLFPQARAGRDEFQLLQPAMPAPEEVQLFQYAGPAAIVPPFAVQPLQAQNVLRPEVSPAPSSVVVPKFEQHEPVGVSIHSLPLATTHQPLRVNNPAQIAMSGFSAAASSISTTQSLPGVLMAANPVAPVRPLPQPQAENQGIELRTQPASVTTPKLPEPIVALKEQVAKTGQPSPPKQATPRARTSMPRKPVVLACNFGFKPPPQDKSKRKQAAAKSTPSPAKATPPKADNNGGQHAEASPKPKETPPSAKSPPVSADRKAHQQSAPPNDLSALSENGGGAEATNNLGSSMGNDLSQSAAAIVSNLPSESVGAQAPPPAVVQNDLNALPTKSNNPDTQDVLGPNIGLQSSAASAANAELSRNFNNQPEATQPGRQQPVSAEQSGPAILSVEEAIRTFLQLQTAGSSDMLKLGRAVLGGDADEARAHLVEKRSRVNEAFSDVDMTCAHLAVLSGSVEMLELMREFDATFTQKLVEGSAPIHLAAAKNFSDCITTLHRFGCDLNTKTYESATPLHLTCVAGYADATRRLCELGAELHSQDEEGNMPLHKAVGSNHSEVVDVLLEAGADPGLQNNRGFNSLHQAAFQGLDGAVRKMLDRHPPLVNARMPEGYVALHIASINNHYHAAVILLEQPDVEINALDKDRATPLMLAVKKGRKACVELLVKKGADINIADDDGDTSLHAACLSMSLTALTNGGALADMRDGDGKPSPEIDELQWRMGQGTDNENKALAVACFLAKEGGESGYFNNKGTTPLDLCFSEEATEAVRAYAQGRGGAMAGAGPKVNDLAGSRSTAVQRTCSVCSSPVTVRFQPCGHEEMCESCSGEVLTCPARGCHTRVASRVLLDGTPLQDTVNYSSDECVMCSNKASVLFQPCGHMVMCIGCCIFTKKCPQCKVGVRQRLSQKRDVEYLRAKNDTVVEIPIAQDAEHRPALDTQSSTGSTHSAADTAEAARDPGGAAAASTPHEAAGRSPIQHVTLNLLGQAGAGKSCLLEKLAGRPFDPRRSSTLLMDFDSSCSVSSGGEFISQASSAADASRGVSDGAPLAGGNRLGSRMDALLENVHENVPAENGGPAAGISLTICDHSGHRIFATLQEGLGDRQNAVNVVCFNAAQDLQSDSDSEEFVCPGGEEMLTFSRDPPATALDSLKEQLSKIQLPSSAQSRPAPVLLVGTNADRLPGGIVAQRRRSQLWAQISEHCKDLPIFHAMLANSAATHDEQSMCLIDNAAADESSQDMRRLRSQLAQAVLQVAGSRPAAVPKPWAHLFRVVKHLATLKESLFDGKGYVPTRDLRHIAEQACGMTSSQDFDAALEHLEGLRHVLRVQVPSAVFDSALPRKPSAASTGEDELEVVVFDLAWLSSELSRLLFGNSFLGASVDEEEEEPRKWLRQTGKLTKELIMLVWRKDMELQAIAMATLRRLAVAYCSHDNDYDQLGSEYGGRRHGDRYPISSVYLVPSSVTGPAESSIPIALQQFQAGGQSAISPPPLLVCLGDDDGSHAALSFARLLLRLLVLWRVRVQLDPACDDDDVTVTRDYAQLVLPLAGGDEHGIQVHLFLGKCPRGGGLVLGLVVKNAAPSAAAEVQRGGSDGRTALIAQVCSSVREHVLAAVQEMLGRRPTAEFLLPWPPACQCNLYACSGGNAGWKVALPASSAGGGGGDASVAPGQAAARFPAQVTCTSCGDVVVVPATAEHWLEIPRTAPRFADLEDIETTAVPPLCNNRLERAFKRCKPDVAGPFALRFHELQARGVTQALIDEILEACDELEDTQLIQLMTSFKRPCVLLSPAQPLCTEDRARSMLAPHPRYFRVVALLELVHDWLRHVPGAGWRADMIAMVTRAARERGDGDDAVGEALRRLARALVAMDASHLP